MLLYYYNFGACNLLFHTLFVCESWASQYQMNNTIHNLKLTAISSSLGSSPCPNHTTSPCKLALHLWIVLPVSPWLPFWFLLNWYLNWVIDGCFYFILSWWFWALCFRWKSLGMLISHVVARNLTLRFLSSWPKSLCLYHLKDYFCYEIMIFTLLLYFLCSHVNSTSVIYILETCFSGNLENRPPWKSMHSIFIKGILPTLAVSKLTFCQFE